MVRFWRSVVKSLKLVGMLSYVALRLVFRRPVTREAQSEWPHRYAGWVLAKVGIAVRQEGLFPERGLVISNHLGYLDIMSFAALHRCVFVSKAEVRSWPFLGWFTRSGGTLYVHRGRGGSVNRVKDQLQATADAGIPVVIFPEGTTTSGSTVLKFHTGLLVEAIKGGQPVTAAHVQYRLTEDNGPGVTVSDVCYWDDTPLLVHMFRVLGLRGIEVTVRFSDAPIVFSASPDERALVAEEARAAVMRLGCVAENVPASRYSGAS